MNDGTDLEVRLGQLIDLLVNQHRSGQRVELEATCEKYPELATRVRELFSAVLLLEDHKPQGTRAAEPPHGLASDAQMLAGYELVREIGRGGMGVVYEAVQQSLGRRVALKVISDHLVRDSLAVERFRREARLASVLHHSNIVPVFDVGESEGVCFYAMQYIHGQSLDQVISELNLVQVADRADQSQANAAGMTKGITSPSTFCSTALIRNSARIALQVAEALEYAHSRGILHRDVKPANILIDVAGNAWITDFGLARLDDSAKDQPAAPLTEAGGVAGTLRYMAPERLRGRSDHRADIYGLAATVYELVTGQPTHDGVDRIHLMHLMANYDPVSPRSHVPSIPRDLETVLLKGLKREMDERYATAGAMADDLRMFLLGRPVMARRTSWMERSVRWCQRNRLAAILLVVLALSLITLLTGWGFNTVLKRQRDEAVELSQRATRAETESRLRATLNDIAVFRQSLEPQLTPMLANLEAWSATADLPESLRFPLRCEIAACAMRSDWYRESSVVSAPTTFIALDRKCRRWASVDHAGNLGVGEYPPSGNMSYDIPISFAPIDCRFSQHGNYLQLANGVQCQVVRLADKIPLLPPNTIAAGIHVNDRQDIAVTWSDDRSVRYWKLGGVAAEIAAELPLLDSALTCRISPNGELMACATRYALEIRSLPSGELLHSIANACNGVLEWSRDGRWLAIAQRNCHIEIRAADDLRLYSVIPAHGTFVHRVDWDSRSLLLAAQNWDGSAHVFDPWTGRTLVRSREPVHTLQFDREDRWVGWEYRNGNVCLLKWRQGLAQDMSASTTGFLGSLRQLVVASKHDLLATMTPDQVCVFDLRSGTLAASLPTFRPVDIDFAAEDSALVILGTNSIQSWPLTIETDGSSIAFGPPSMVQLAPLVAGELFPERNSAVVLDSTTHVYEIDMTSGAIRRKGNATGFQAIRRLGKSPMAALHDWHSPDVQLLNLNTMAVCGSLETGVTATLFADESGRTVAASNGQQYRFWNGDTLEPQEEKSVGTSIVSAQLAWNSVGTEMVLQTTDRNVDLLTAATGELVVRLPTEPVGNIHALSFACGGRFLVAAGPQAGVMRRWDLGTLRQRLRDSKMDWDTNIASSAEALPITPTIPRKFRVLSGTLLGLPTPWGSLRLLEAKTQVEQTPDSALSCNNLAWRLLILDPTPENCELALKLAERAVELEGTNPSFRNTLGFALYRVGRYPEALAALNEGQHPAEENGRCHHQVVLGLAAQAMGDHATAALCSSMVQGYLNRAYELTISQRADLKLLLDELQNARGSRP